MNTRSSLYLHLPFLVLLANLRIACTLAGGAGAVTLTFTNNCPYTVWPGMLTGRGGGQLSSTGFELATGASFSINDVPDMWSGRVWGRTGCATDASGKFFCATADCGSGQVSCDGAGAIQPASLAEFTLAPAGSSQQDFYDISLVDGFNLLLSATPQGSGSGCRTTSCGADINYLCPSELAVRGSDGSNVACKSACTAFNQPKYCCTGAYGTPDTCQPKYCCTGAYGTPDTCQPTNYTKIVKAQCPHAYSYAFDDTSSTFTCAGGADYLITFCPQHVLSFSELEWTIFLSEVKI